MRIHLHVHGVFLRAQHLHLRHAGDHGDALRDARLGVLVERPQRQRGRGQREVENRLIGRIDLGERRRRRHALRQQARGLRDGRLHVHRGAVQPPREVEFQRDLRVAQRVRTRGHRVQAGDGGELIFERRRHGGRHGLRTRAGQAAVTSRVGKSTLGRSLTASDRYATPPNSAIAAISRLVAMGRSINVWEMFMRFSTERPQSPACCGTGLACPLTGTRVSSWPSSHSIFRVPPPCRCTPPASGRASSTAKTPGRRPPRDRAACAPRRPRRSPARSATRRAAPPSWSS